MVCAVWMACNGLIIKSILNLGIERRYTPDKPPILGPVAFQHKFDQSVGNTVGMAIAIMAAFIFAMVTICDLRAWLRNRTTLVVKHDTFLDNLKKESPHVLDLITAHQLKCSKYSIENVVSQSSRSSRSGSVTALPLEVWHWLFTGLCCQNEIQPENDRNESQVSHATKGSHASKGGKLSAASPVDEHLSPAEPAYMLV